MRYNYYYCTSQSIVLICRFFSLLKSSPILFEVMLAVYKHQEFQFPLLDAAHCGTESEHQASNGSLIGLFSLLSCLLLREYWNFVPNNNNIPVKETKIWLSFKTWWSFSVPQCTASRKRNWNSWCLYRSNIRFPSRLLYSLRERID